MQERNAQRQVTASRSSRQRDSAGVDAQPLRVLNQPPVGVRRILHRLVRLRAIAADHPVIRQQDRVSLLRKKTRLLLKLRRRAFRPATRIEKHDRWPGIRAPLRATFVDIHQQIFFTDRLVDFHTIGRGQLRFVGRLPTRHRLQRQTGNERDQTIYPRRKFHSDFLGRPTGKAG